MCKWLGWIGLGMSFCKGEGLPGEQFFPAERIAIDLNLSTFAENRLRHHVLDAFPKGSICRWLLAKIDYQTHEFEEMAHQIQLAGVNPQYAYLKALLLWTQHQQVILTPLLFAPQEGIAGVCLSRFNAVLQEPIGSPRWAHFWFQQQNKGLLDHEPLTALMTAMAFTVQGNCFNANVQPLDWHSFSASLWGQKRYDALAHFLAQILPQLTVHREKTHCFLDLLRVKSLLKQDATAEVAKYLSYSTDFIPQLDVILMAWMNTVPQNQQRLQGLNQFYQIYKKDPLNLNGQYIKILQIQCLIHAQQVARAQKSLTKLFKVLNESLYGPAYELLAKIEFLKLAPNYSAAANALEEAKKYTHQKYKLLLYSKIQSECYCLLKDYHRAYCLLQEALFKGQYTPLAADLAYEWCLCGILCKSTAEDLEQQLQYCREKHLLTQYKEQQIRLYFAQYQFNHGAFQLAMDYVKTKRFFRVFNPEVSLIRAKCAYRLGQVQLALKILNGTQKVPPSIYPEWQLWQAYIYNDLNRSEEAEKCLKSFLESPSVSAEIRTYGYLLQAEILYRQHALGQAKQVLLDLEPRVEKEWWPVVLFQAGCYAEQNGFEGKKEAIAIFQKIYERAPEHPLAQDARLKQGVLLMNLNQMDLAQSIFTDLYPALKGTQALWCQFLIQKCNLLQNKNKPLVAKTQLELLLKESMPLSLRLEIVLQLAFIYHDEGHLNAFQTLLWEECYPIFDLKNKQDFSASEVYWFSRCLLTLAQHTQDPTLLNQIYTLMVEAELPNASIVQQYLRANS